MDKRILVVEDDKKLGRILELQLSHGGYEPTVVDDGAKADELLKRESFDLGIFDVMLPGLNGFELCRRLRERSDMPVIMLTAKDSVSDKVLGFDFGADDYLTKPFEPEELMARVKARLKRAGQAEAHATIDIEDLSIDTAGHSVTRAGKAVSLSKTEYDLLLYLASNRGIVLTREQLLDKVWGYSYYGGDNVLDVYIKYVRDKIDKPFEKKLIETVRGVGYVIR